MKISSTALFISTTAFALAIVALLSFVILSILNVPLFFALLISGNLLLYFILLATRYYIKSNRGPKRED